MIHARAFPTLTFVLGVVTAPICAQAAEPVPYVSVGAAIVSDSSSVQYTSALIRGGVEFNRYFGLEVEGLIGLGSVDEGIPGVVLSESRFKHQLGGYGVVSLPVGETVKLYVRAGAATSKRETKLEFQGQNNILQRDTFSETITGPSLGLGVQGLFGQTRKSGIRLDITGSVGSLEDEGSAFLNDGSAYASVAYVRRF